MLLRDLWITPRREVQERGLGGPLPPCCGATESRTGLGVSQNPLPRNATYPIPAACRNFANLRPITPILSKYQLPVKFSTISFLFTDITLEIISSTCSFSTPFQRCVFICHAAFNCYLISVLTLLKNFGQRNVPIKGKDTGVPATSSSDAKTLRIIN